MKNNAAIVYNVFLVIGDFFALLAAFVVAYILRVSINHSPLSTPIHALTYLYIFLSLLPFWILIFALLNLYDFKIYERRFSEFGRLFIGSFIGVLFVISYSYVTNTTIFPARLVTLYGFLLAFVFVLLFRTIARGTRRQLFSYGIGINDVLIVGDTRISHELLQSLDNSAVTGYRVVGLVGGHKDLFLLNQDYPPIFASFAAAITKLKGQSLHTIIQTELFASTEQNDEIVTYAQENHVAYRFVPGNSELFTGNLDVELFHSVPVVVINQTALVGWGRVVKRLFDTILGSISLIIASPFMLVIALAIKLSDPGNVIFKQQRLSRFGKKVYIYKFRSHKKKYNGLSPEEAFRKMGQPGLIQQYRDNGDQLDNDPRVSRIGRFLRRTSLDELPQLINVVRGDISLVGPRALVPFELEQYSKKNLILSVRSGLTGLAQISGRRDINFEERRQLDLYYVQNWSIWNDIVILVKTVWIVLFHRGAS